MIDLTEYNLNNVSNYGTVNLLKKKPIKIQLWEQFVTKIKLDRY